MATRYERALSRNAAELQKAILIRKTLIGIEKHEYVSKTFTRIIYDALFNDYISHAIKVFENSKQASSFWYIYRSNQRPVDRYARQEGYDISILREVSAKLRNIRNGTHFHIDEEGVLNPSEIWRGADLSGTALAGSIDFAWGAITSIQNSIGQKCPSLGNYTISDAERAIELIESST